MSIDRWNREDSARLKRVEEKLDALASNASATTVINNLSTADLDAAIARNIDEACRPGGVLSGQGR